MAGLTGLPIEILDQIISEISPEQQRSLANFSETCCAIYHQVIPVLYHTYRLKFWGRSSWPTQTEKLRRLVPPGSYEVPSYTREDCDEAENEAMIDRKGKGVADRSWKTLYARKDAAGSAATLGKKPERRLPLLFIREIAICGFWNHEQEEQQDEYFLHNDGDIREHTPFVEALEGLLWSIERLESFSWRVIRPLPHQISAAVARFDTLCKVEIFGDTHMYMNHPSYRYHPHSPTPLCNSPVPFSNNSLVSLKALQTGDYQQVIQYGDVMRTGSNWETLRELEFDISPGFIGMLVEMEPMEPDILAALFRPPPPPRGRLTTPKMKLHRLKLRDVAFQEKGITAITKSIDPAELRDLDFYYCQEGTDLLRQWENNKLKNLERVHIKEELALPYLCKFLKQFGPEGTCRNLKTLELCCWHVDRWNMYDSMHHTNVSMFADYDSDSEAWDEDEMMYPDSDSLMDPNDYAFHGYPMILPPAPPVPKYRYPLPQPFRSIKDLRGNKEEGWGLERLVLDMRPGVSAITTRQLPQQEIFFEGFWRIRELAIPVSYETADCWNQFVETIAKLPNLEYLYLLNARTEARSGPNYVNFNIYQPPFAMVPPLAPHLGGLTLRTTTTGKRKAKSREQEPDKLYIDALSIASKNRLRVHSNGVPSPSSSSASSSTAQTVWRGKLKYIGIRAMSPMGIRQPLRVWKVVVSNAPPKKSAPDGAAERRRSLRSSKRRKVESGDWKVAEEGNLNCSLVELEDEAEKKRIGDGIFKGMQRFADDDTRLV
ncbi:hypothetical protein BDD12DRAFT_914077 [Trichophaea hybrida]|nr:hypothetical protein BDD12DRAFT_914077 [Trichophaea hybrida]